MVLIPSGGHFLNPPGVLGDRFIRFVRHRRAAWTSADRLPNAFPASLGLFVPPDSRCRIDRLARVVHGEPCQRGARPVPRRRSRDATSTASASHLMRRSGPRGSRPTRPARRARPVHPRSEGRASWPDLLAATDAERSDFSLTTSACSASTLATRSSTSPARPPVHGCRSPQTRIRGPDAARRSDPTSVARSRSGRQDAR